MFSLSYSFLSLWYLAYSDLFIEKSGTYVLVMNASTKLTKVTVTVEKKKKV